MQMGNLSTVCDRLYVSRHLHFTSGPLFWGGGYVISFPSRVVFFLSLVTSVPCRASSCLSRVIFFPCQVAILSSVVSFRCCRMLSSFRPLFAMNRYFLTIDNSVFLLCHVLSWDMTSDCRVVSCLHCHPRSMSSCPILPINHILPCVTFDLLTFAACCI